MALWWRHLADHELYIQSMWAQHPLLHLETVTLKLLSVHQLSTSLQQFWTSIHGNLYTLLRLDEQ